MWTDKKNEEFTKKHFPDFYPIFMNFSRNIMRADVIRYLIMYKIGGLYLDLDYEMIKPYNFENKTLILPKNRNIKSEHDKESLGNAIFASEPNNVFWKDVINDLQKNPPLVNDYTQIVDATGPGLLTRIFHENSDKYLDAELTEKDYFHIGSPNNKKEYLSYLEKDRTSGTHHCSGSWKERFTMKYLEVKLKKGFK